MKKITQKKSNLKILVESIAKSMAICESYMKSHQGDACASLNSNHSNTLSESKDKKRFMVKYRGCHKGYSPECDDPNVGTVYELTLPEILHEINRDRGKDWIDFDESNWRDGLDNWTFYEPVDSRSAIV